MRAGINVALLAFPQGMAYAAIAGLPIQYGIFGSAIAALIGPLFAGGRFIILGPTNATSVLLFASFLTLEADPQTRLIMAPMMILMAGIFLVAGSFLRVANLIQYVSRSVVTGYITAAAIFIILNQIRKAFGFTFDIPAGSSFLDILWLTIANLPSSHIPTIALSIATLGFYYALKKWNKALPHVAITLVVMSSFAWVMDWALVKFSGLAFLGGPVALLTEVDASQWLAGLPEFRGEWISELAPIALIIAFLSILEGSSIGKSLAARAGKRIDANQEMFGMGMANLACAFYQGMPASGSLTRSQLNFESSGITPMASIFSGLLCVIGAYLLGPYTKFIPVSVLGVLVILIGMSLINRHVLRVVVRSTRSDAIVFGVTFIAALIVRLDFAIILGAAVSILLFLQKAAVPELVEYGHDQEGQLTPISGGGQRERQEVSIVHVEGDLFFGAAELFRDQMRRVCEAPNLRVVILKMRNAHHLDATSVLALEELVRYMSENGRTLLISEARKEAIRIFRRSGLTDIIGRENIFPDIISNPTLSTAKALRRAMQILGDTEAHVSIFVGKSQRQKNDTN